MDLKETGIKYEELGSFGSRQGLLESTSDCDIEPPDSIIQGVS